MEQTFLTYEEYINTAKAHYQEICDKCEMPFPDETKVVVNQDEGDGSVTVRIQGILSEFFGFDVRSLIAQLDELQPSRLNVLIESPGGNVFDGLALWNDFRARAEEGVEIITEARGAVASAAVFPFLAGKTRIMRTGTNLMIHLSMMGMMVFGNKHVLNEAYSKADKALNAIDTQLEDIIKARTGKTKKQVNEWITEETWFSPQEAVDGGFATEIKEEAKPDEVNNSHLEEVFSNNQIERLFHSL